MKLKWYGTATVLIDQDNTQLLFDPFFPLNKKNFAPPIGELSLAEYILVTHGHFDHVTGIPSIFTQEHNKAKVFCTAAPRESLIKKDVPQERIHKITSGGILNLGPFEVRVLKGRHIVFNMRLILKKLFNPRWLFSLKKLTHILKENKICRENGETVIYDISVSSKRILLPGSMGLDKNTDYPKGADLLILPFQGRSDIGKYAMRFIERLQPKKVLLTHFDNSFPPVSSLVKTESFIADMRRKFPDIPVICQEPSAEWIDI